MPYGRHRYNYELTVYSRHRPLRNKKGKTELEKVKINIIAYNMTEAKAKANREYGKVINIKRK